MKAKDDGTELIRGSGNVFADFGGPDAETKHLEAQMAADIINTLDHHGLSVRAAVKVTQVGPADIQRICIADLSRFTIDRLVRTAYRLCREPDLRMINVRSDAVA